jgi:hypothetical protein
MSKFCLIALLTCACTTNISSGPDAGLDPSTYILDEAQIVKIKPHSDPFCAVTTCCTSDDMNNGGPGWCSLNKRSGDAICHLNCGAVSHCGNIGDCDESIFFNEDGVLVTHVQCRCSEIEP